MRIRRGSVRSNVMRVVRLIDEELVCIWRHHAKGVVSWRFEASREDVLVGSIEHDRPQVLPFERLAPAVDDAQPTA